MVEPSLLRKNELWLEKIHLILDEMVARGNLIAGLRKAELQQLDETLTRLHTASTNSVTPRDCYAKLRGRCYGRRECWRYRFKSFPNAV